MNKFSKILLLVIIAVSLSSIGWNNFKSEGNSAAITDYYYYQGSRYYLVHKPDMIYIKLKHVMTEQEFTSQFSSYGLPDVSVYPFDSKDVMQFIKINNTGDNASLNRQVNELRTNPYVEYASPVFGLKEGMGNANTLQGCENNISAQFKPGVSMQQINQYLSSRGMTIIKELEVTGGLTFQIQIPATENTTSLDYSNELWSSGLVNYSGPGFCYTHLMQFVPNDPFFPMQWSAINTGSNIPGTGTGTANNDMGLDSAWDQTMGISQCRVSVVDSGIDTTHPDYSMNVVNGYNFNYIANSYGGFDDFGHGASCAGIIAAKGNNSIGISGVAPNARIFSAKIFNSAGSTTTLAIQNALIGVRTFGNCWVSSNSWGGGSPDPTSNNAITDGVNLGRNGKGIVWVFAVGNGNTSSVSWPSTQPEVISVGGVSPCNQRKNTSSCDGENWWGSQYGTGLDIVAPCVKIYATVQGGGYINNFNGTSSATPNTSGVCALLLSKDSTQTWDTVRARINRTAQKRGSYSYTSAGPLTQLGNTWNNEMGYGIVNANLALLAVGPPPANDVTVGPFLSFPANFVISTAYNIRSRVSNIGTNTQTNIPMKFFVNGSQVGSTVNIASLTSGASDSVTFSWTPGSTGSFTLKIAHGLATDANRFNDTVTAVVTVLPQNVGNSTGTFCRNGLNKPILDNSTTYDTLNLNISNAFNVIDVNVKVDTVVHTYDGDLSITINHLSNSSQLSTNRGGSGDNFINTVFNDSSTTLIGSGTSPFTGSFRPESPLTIFNNNPVNGAWVLSVNDNAAQDTGTLRAWCLVITYQSLIGGIHTVEIPNYYSLSQNYPNPFNPVTNIRYTIPNAGITTLKIYDVLGREVAVLVNEMRQPGVYTADFDASQLASGIYFYKLESGDFSAVKKMMLVK